MSEKEIPSYWKAIINRGELTVKDYWEKVEPCHILIGRAKERQKKEILKDLEYWINTNREGISTLYILKDIKSKWEKK